MLTKFKIFIGQYVKNERGAQAIEWIALGIVVIAVLGAIATAMTDDKIIASAVKETLSNLIKSLGATGGGEG
ncbi:hypothetical protein [Alkalihalobacillus sp. LMS39]|uniref:hypothetical protein n=1 Tax=Alkalihalobacillus sp. LMS39 TaxID=2924032 RepID=UPI001FB35A38|nr:hypothetical protein [Alkalihalobacillus sp. LMS39]UOE92260.1 hypothetical protein MM271_13425 [Alkalihalobacillus sp. LMS39]